jgi:hypothetical protein
MIAATTFVIALYAAVILCAVFAFLCGKKLIRIEAAFLLKVNEWVCRMLPRLNLYLSILGTLFASIVIFIGAAGPVRLSIIALLSAAGFVFEHFLNQIAVSENALSQEYAPFEGQNYKAVFGYITLVNEINKNVKTMLDAFAESREQLIQQMKQTVSRMEEMGTHIDEYVSFQKDQCAALLTKQNQCTAAFTTLEKNAASCAETFFQYEKKLSQSAASLMHCEESEQLLSDLHESFQKAFNQSAEESMRQADSILSTLHTIEFKYAAFKSYLKPYEDIVNIYGTKIESSLSVFDEKNKTRQKELKEMAEALSASLAALTGEVRDTLHEAEPYFKQNAFVLSTIAESLNTGTLRRRQLKEIMGSKTPVPVLRPRHSAP